MVSLVLFLSSVLRLVLGILVKVVLVGVNIVNGLGFFSVLIRLVVCRVVVRVLKLLVVMVVLMMFLVWVLIVVRVRMERVMSFFMVDGFFLGGGERVGCGWFWGRDFGI